MSPDERGNDIVKFILKREEILKRKVDSLQKKLFKRLIENVLSLIDVEDGSIKGTRSNQKLIEKIDRIFDKFGKNENLNVVNQFRKDLLNVVDKNTTYFSAIAGSSDDIPSINKSVRGTLFNQLGLSSTGKKIIGGGFFDSLISDVTVKRGVREIVFRNITSSRSLKDFTSELKTFVIGNSDKEGKLQTFYRQFAYQTYQDFDALNSKLFADQLELTASIYSGGIIRTSRDFCRDRNNRVFTNEEIREWGLIEASGKPLGWDSNNRAPGGYGCRHRLNYISNEEAVSRRSDLEIVNGKLVKK